MGAASGAASGAAAGTAIAPGVGTVIGAGLGALGSIFGSKKNADANEQANATQSDYNAKALAAAEEQQQYDRGQQSQYLQRLATYSSTSGAALNRLDTLLQPSQIGMSGNSYSSMRSTAPVTQQTAPAPTRASIQLQSPTGSGFQGFENIKAATLKNRQLSTANPLFVTMQFPDGTKRLVPPESIAASKQQGAVAVA